jgi:tetratricopeptide (TPR) repeat protein
MARAMPFAEKALELDPELPGAHTAIGVIRWQANYDAVGAEESFRRAIEFDPGSVGARKQYGLLLASTGRLDEAIEQMETALDLDPLATGPLGFDLGKLYMAMGDTDRALAYWERIIGEAPGYFQPQANLGDYHCRTGNPAKGIPLIERAITLSPDEPWLVAQLAYCYAISGNRGEAKEILEELEALSSDQYVDPTGLALVHAGLGEMEEAFEELERGAELRAIRIKEIGIDPRFEPLHADPRFTDLLERMGLPTPLTLQDRA